MEKVLPSDKEHFRMLEGMYLFAPFNKTLKSRINISDSSCEINVEDADEFHHAASALHGAILFKMLDDAAYFSCASQVKEKFLVTTSFHISYHRPATKGSLTATGHVVQKGRNMFVAESKIYSASGKLIASGTGHFAKSNIELSPEIGYKL